MKYTNFLLPLRREVRGMHSSVRISFMKICWLVRIIAQWGGTCVQHWQKYFVGTKKIQSSKSKTCTNANFGI